MGKKVLPVYKVVINPDDKSESGVKIISLVNQPAMESNFIALSKEVKLSSDEIIKSINDIEVKFGVSDFEKRLVSGVLLIPNKPIYRNVKGIGECMWIFDAETILMIRDKYHKLKYTSNVNLEHQEMTDNCYQVESFIVNKKRGIFPNDLKDVVDDALVVTFKIENDEVLDGIKDGTYNGFSIQGLVDLIELNKEVIITYSAADYYNDLLKEYNEMINTERC